MARLAELYGETVHLAVLERGRVLYLEKQQGNRAIQVNITGVGAYLYAHASALGKVLLSGLSEKEVIAVVRTHGLPALTPNTITTLEELLSELRGCGSGATPTIWRSTFPTSAAWRPPSGTTRGR